MDAKTLKPGIVLPTFKPIGQRVQAWCDSSSVDEVIIALITSSSITRLGAGHALALGISLCALKYLPKQHDNLLAFRDWYQDAVESLMGKIAVRSPLIWSYYMVTGFAALMGYYLALVAHCELIGTELCWMLFMMILVALQRNVRKGW